MLSSSSIDDDSSKDIHQGIIILKAQVGDPDALKELVKIMEPIIKLEALKFLSSGIPLDDLMQHAWLHFFDDSYRCLKQYAPRENATFKGFIATSTRHCLLDYIKAQKLRRMDVLAVENSDVPSAEQLAIIRRFSEDEVLAKERRAISINILSQVLPLLSSEQRRALEENIMEGKTYDQIAKEEGVERVTIGTRIHRAKHKILAILKAMGIKSSEDIFDTPGKPNKKVEAKRGKKNDTGK